MGKKMVMAAKTLQQCSNSPPVLGLVDTVTGGPVGIKEEEIYGVADFQIKINIILCCKVNHEILTFRSSSRFCVNGAIKST